MTNVFVDEQYYGSSMLYYTFQDANEALGTEHYFDEQPITVNRYFTCIERSEPNIVSCERINGLTVCVSQGNWSEMNFQKIR